MLRAIDLPINPRPMYPTLSMITPLKYCENYKPDPPPPLRGTSSIFLENGGGWEGSIKEPVSITETASGVESRVSYFTSYVTLTMTVKVNCPGWIGTAAASDAAPPPPLPSNM